MTTTRNTMQMALEALEQLDGIDTETECVTIDVGNVIEALKAELARVQEPVAYAYKNEFGITLSEHDCAALPDGVSTPLYAAPQPAVQQPHGYKLVPVEPTEAMLDEFSGTKFRKLNLGKQAAEIRAYADMLAAAPQPVQQRPINCGTGHCSCIECMYPQPPLSHECTRSHPHELMDGYCQLRTEIARLTNENARLKAAPQPVQPNIQTQITKDISPLSDEQIRQLRKEGYDAEDRPEPWSFEVGVRAAEQFHGIGVNK